MHELNIRHKSVELSITPFVEQGSSVFVPPLEAFSDQRSLSRFKHLIHSNLRRQKIDTLDGLEVKTDIKVSLPCHRVFDDTILEIVENISYKNTMQLSEFPNVRYNLELRYVNKLPICSLQVFIDNKPLGIEISSTAPLLGASQKEVLRQYGSFANKILLFSDVLDAISDRSPSFSFTDCYIVTQLITKHINSSYNAIYKALNIKIALPAVLSLDES